MQAMTNAITYASRVATGKTVEKVPENPVAISEAIAPGPLEAVPSAASEGIPDERQNTTTSDPRRRPRRYLTLREKYERKRDQLADCAADLEQARLVCDAFKRELRIEREKSQQLALQRDGLNVKLSECSNSLESERRLRADADDLLAKRTAELDATKALLPATESITDTSIVNLFGDLNYEIAQTATTLAEAYEDVVRAPLRTSKIQPEVKACLEASGALLLLKLPSKSAVDPTTALQIGFQAAIVDLARTFLDDGVYQDTQGLKPIITALKENEPELVAGRWSALAHQYTRVTAKDHSEQRLARRLASLLGDALVVAGCEAEKDSSASSNADIVLSKTGDSLVGVARLLIELDVILGEKVAVGWMEGFVAVYGESFRKESMDAAFQGDSPSKKERVVCSTALGLRRIVKGESTVLLKPMVALSSLLPARRESKTS